MFALSVMRIGFLSHSRDEKLFQRISLRTEAKAKQTPWKTI